MWRDDPENASAVRSSSSSRARSESSRWRSACLTVARRSALSTSELARCWSADVRRSVRHPLLVTLLLAALAGGCTGVGGWGSLIEGKRDLDSGDPRAAEA